MDAKSTSDSSNGHAKRRVLVVDDEQEIRDLLRRHLAYEGLTVEVAGSGEEALSAMRREPAEVMATDITMPRMNGLRLMEAVRREFPATRMVVMTGRISEETIVNCMRGGADACLLKPLVDMAEFVRTIRHSLAIRAHWEQTIATVRDRARSIGDRPSGNHGSDRPTSLGPAKTGS